MIICLRQFVRPKSPLHLEGVGDCTTCVTDKDNVKCKLYCPVTVQCYTVTKCNDTKDGNIE